MNKYFKLLLVGSVVFTATSLILGLKNKEAIESNALSYKTLSELKDKEIIEFEGGDTLPSGTSITYTGNAKSYLSDTYKNSRLYAARMYTGNYSCSPINEITQEVYLNGKSKTMTVNTTGGYVLGFDAGATVNVSYTSSVDRYADLYVRVASNSANKDAELPSTSKMKLAKMLGVSLNQEEIAINDNATVFGRYYKQRLDEDINDKVSFAYEKDEQGNWKTLSTELNMHGRYVYQDWQTVLVGKVLVRSGENNFTYTAKNGNTSGQLDCMILDFDKYENKDVYEFEDATLTGDAKTLANYNGDYKDLIRDFVTYNKDYSCSNYDFVKYAKNGSTLSSDISLTHSYSNPHLFLRVSSLNVNQTNFVTNSVTVKDHLKVEINESEISIPSSLYIEGRNDSTNHDPDGISHGIPGSLNDAYTSSNTSYAVRYMYLIWRTIDLGPISLNETNNQIKFTIISNDNNEYIGFDYFYIADTNDTDSKANLFASEFVSRLANVCKADGSSNIVELKKIWTDSRDKYALLDEESKSIIANGIANDNSNEDVARYLARYDYIGQKYNASLVDDGQWNFLNRDIVNSSLSIFAEQENNKTAILVTILLAQSFVILGGVLLLKKHKAK